MMRPETQNFTKVEGLEVLHIFMEKHGLEKLNITNIDVIFSSLEFLQKLLVNLGRKEIKQQDLELIMYTISMYEKEKRP